MTLAAGNGDLGEVRWTVILYWVVMIILAVASINSQLQDRKMNLEAYEYKFNANT